MEKNKYFIALGVMGLVITIQWFGYHEFPAGLWLGYVLGLMTILALEKS